MTTDPRLSERFIYGEISVPAAAQEVWDAWTTRDGIRSFFAPDCNVDLRPGGAYEILFAPSARRGQRGGEGNRVLAIQPTSLLSFTWNAPPSLPEVREHRTHVVVRLMPEGPERTRVALHHDGWGSGGQWDEAFGYFDRAWNEVVLPRLRQRFEDGPLDWNT